MNYTLATKTLAAIDACMIADQGASFRQWQGKVLPHLEDAYRGQDDGVRSHLGASLIGRDCDRQLWYGFHWTSKEVFNGQKLRLFNRGHLEEGRFIAMMLMIGCEVYQQDANGKQFRISEVGGHFGGSGDGVIVGLPDLVPGTPALSEWKTHNDASFKKLVAEGVRAAKFEHWVQMQTYMYKMGLAVAIYGAVNKNDDNIHMEIVKFDPAAGPFFIERARRIITLYEQPPKKIKESAGAYECKWCSFKPVCKLGAEPMQNCRTCQHSAVNTDDGKWYCNSPRVNAIMNTTRIELSKDQQIAGCEHYAKITNI